MPKLNYYDTLGIARESSNEEITVAYREAAKKYHPDKHQGAKEKDAAHRNFKIVQNAYENLIDPQKRSRYDEKLRKQDELEHKRQELYDMLVQAKNEVTTEEEYLELAKRFRAMGGYKDTAELARQCEARYQSLKESRKEKKQRDRQQRKEENRELHQVLRWVSGAAVAAVVLIVVTIAVIDRRGVSNREIAELPQEQVLFEPAQPPFENIFEAAEKGTVEDMRFFLVRGKGIDQIDERGWTLLHYAAEHNPNVAVMQFLIAQGADVNVRNNEGWALLDVTQLDERRAILREAGAVPYQSPFENIFEAAQKGAVNDVRYFLDRGEDVNAKNNEGRTPLHHAAWHNPNVDVLLYLVSQGADVNARNNWEKTPLYFAAERNPNVDVLRYLVSQGADVNAVNNNGETPLHCAATHNSNVEVVKYLVSLGASVNAKNNDGETPLYHAAANPNVEILKYLISQGADVNAKKNDGTTPLLFATFSANTNVENLQYLISQGADVNAKRNDNATILHCFAWSSASNVEVFRFLIAQGADINAKDVDGRTPLDHANTEEKRVILRAAGGRSGQ